MTTPPIQTISTTEHHYQGGVLVRSYNKTYSSTQHYCPSCGKQDIWRCNDGGDHYLGQQYLCASCATSHYLDQSGLKVERTQEFSVRAICQATGREWPDPTPEGATPVPPGGGVFHSLTPAEQGLIETWDDAHRQMDKRVDQMLNLGCVPSE